MVILWILYVCVFVCLALRWHKMCYECMVNSPLPESRRAIFEREKKTVRISVNKNVYVGTHTCTCYWRSCDSRTYNQKPASKRNEKQTDRSIHAYELKVLRERIHRGTFIKRTILCLFTSIYQQRKSIWLTFDGWVASHSVLSDWHLVISGDFFLFGNRNAKYHKT